MDWTGLLTRDWLFSDWAGVLRVAVVGLCAYAALVLMLRVSGKRTLAKLNAFDLVVTVALGSTLASILLSPTLPLAEGLMALFLLIGMQYVVAFVSVRSRGFARLVRSEPVLLVRTGSLCEAAMRRARVTEAELRTVVRATGNSEIEDVAAVVLESDGSFSVLPGGTDLPTMGKARAREAVSSRPGA